VPRRVLPAAAHDSSAASELIYVVRRQWHIDVGFAAPEPTAPLAGFSARLQGAQYLLFGFGDRHYLTAKGSVFPDMLIALWPGPGLLLVSGLGAPPQQAFGPANVVALHVTSLQRRAAETFVLQSLSDPGGRFEPYALGPYQGSLYFSATARYSGLYTCNTWAAQVLQAAGLPVRSAGVVFASQLWRQIHRWAAGARLPLAAALSRV
jgi:hypothetical protein